MAMRGTLIACSGAVLYLSVQQVSGLVIARADGPRAASVAITGRVRFGVIADVQHADADNGMNFAKTVKRHYRGALAQLRRASAWWVDEDAREPLAFVANLGDVIDGMCASLGQSERALADATAEFDRVPTKHGTVHLVGNHELYNFPDRAELRARLNGAAQSPNFCSFAVSTDTIASPADGAATDPDAELDTSADTAAPGRRSAPFVLRVVVLDPYRISMMTPADDETRAAARALLRAHNPNNVEGPGNFAKGLERSKRHFVPYNGALGEAQLSWLRAEVLRSAGAGERVLVLCHTPLHPGACEGSTMPWDYEKALDALGAAPAGTVVAVLAGHDHKGGYVCDGNGVHHLTLQSPLNLGERGDAYGLIELTEAELSVSGPRLNDLLPRALLTDPAQSVSNQPLRLMLRAAVASSSGAAR
jgi:manganese-dependent ADP-ribose/CDP-alcohol diphosphatase